MCVHVCESVCVCFQARAGAIQGGGGREDSVCVCVCECVYVCVHMSVCVPVCLQGQSWGYPEQTCCGEVERMVCMCLCVCVCV